MAVRDDEVILADARAGDSSAFAELAERYRGELRVHCYRMLGSFDESEDLVQETFLRAWKALGRFEGRCSLRAWLYRIATNACLDVLDSRSRRLLPHQVIGPAEPGTEQPPRGDIDWLQPFPDRFYEPSGPVEAEPDAVAVAKETIELAFLAAIQYLPPRQRAALILRDVLGWSAKDTATLLDSSIASANSAVQRARSTLRSHLPDSRLDWAPSVEPTGPEREVLRRYMDAVERADLAAVADLLADEVRSMMPPFPVWFQGRDAVLAALAKSWDPASSAYVGQFQMVATQANRQPAAAAYVRHRGESIYRAFAIAVLRIEGGQIVEVTAFHDPERFADFGLAGELEPAHR